MTIYSSLPDPEVLLALEPEELAIVILEYLKSGINSSQDLNRYNFSLSHTVEQYPPQYRERIQCALMEGWIWLEREGFIAPRPGDHDDWIFITRKGMQFKSTRDLSLYLKANMLPKGMLHPVILNKVWGMYLKGDYDTAVFQAFKELEVNVREASGLAPEDIGVDLMRKAFNQVDGPLTKKDSVKSEKEALSHLFAGAIGSYKNPVSHRKVAVDFIEAAEMLILASHLMKIVDDRSSHK